MPFPGARAQTDSTWNVNANGNWSLNTNWLPTTAPGTAAGDIARLTNQITTTRTITLDTNATLGLLEIGDVSGDSGFVLTTSGGSVLTFDNGGAGNAILRKIQDGGTDTISAAMQLDDTLEISVHDPDANQVLLLSGIISDGASTPPGSGNTAMIINNHDFYGVNGNWVDWGITRFDGQNTFTGQVLIQSGTLRIEGNNTGINSALGAVGVGNETIVVQGGRLDLRDRDIAVNGQDGTEIVRISGTGLNSFGGNTERGGLGALINTSGTAQLSHLVLDGDATVGGYSTLTIEDHTDSSSNQVLGILDGGGFTLTKRGSNYFILDDTNVSNFKTIDVTEGYLRIAASTLLEAGDYTDGGINVYYNPDAFAKGLGGTRTSDPYNPSTAANGGTTGNSLVESRLEFYTLGHSGDYTHSANINLNRGSILRSGSADTTGSPTSNTILSGTVNLVGGSEVGMNLFSIFGGSNNVGDNPGALVLSGQIDNTSGGNAGVGFDVRGNREFRIISNQSAFDGDILLRYNTNNLPTSSNTSAGFQADIFSMRLTNGGALTGLGPDKTITLQRRASLNLDNTLGNLGNRIDDDATLILRNGYLHFTSNASVDTTETIGQIVSNDGDNFLVLNSRAGAAVDLTIDSLTLNPFSVLKLIDINTGAALGTAPGNDRVLVNNVLASIGDPGANGGTNQDVVLGIFGGVADAYTGAAGHHQTILDNRSSLFAGRRFLTQDGGYLRPLTDAEFTTAATAGQNWRVIASAGNAGGRTNVPTVASDITINSLFLDDQVTQTTAQDLVLIEPGKTLTISSGMISFGSNGGSVSTANMEGIIRGGFLDMNGQTALIASNLHWHDTDNDNVNGNNAFIRSHIVNADGLVKTGRNNLYLDTWNRFNGGARITSTENSSLILRHDRALDGASRVEVTGGGNLLLDQGVDISGVDLWVRPSDVADRTALRAENWLNSWRGDLILDTLDASGSNEFRRTIVTANSDDALNLYGDIYTSLGLPGAQQAPTLMTDSDAWNDPFRISTSSNSTGTVNLHGRVRDTSTGRLDQSVWQGETIAGSQYSNNYSLSFEMTGNDEMNVNVFQQWEATGRLELDRGYFRIHYDPTGQTGSTEGWLTDATRSAITGNAYWNRLALGQDGSGTGVANANLMLTRDGQLMNWPHIYVYNNDPQGTLTLGGENMSGTVYVGSRDNSVSSGIQYASQGASPAERDLRLYQAPGGTMVINAQLDDESNEGGVVSMASKIGLGTVRINDNPKGASDVQAWNVMAGTLEWAWRNSGSGNDRFARVDGNDNGARLLMGGGTLHLIGGTDANRDQDLPGARFTLTPGGSDLWVTAQNTGTARTTRLTIGRGSGTSFFRHPGSLLNVVEDNNGGTSQIQFNASGSLSGSFGSLLNVTIAPWATYGSTPGAVDNFLATDANGQASASAVHVNGLAEVNYAATNHPNVVGDVTFTGISAPETLRFNTDAAALTLDTFAMTVGQGGLLVTSAITTGASLSGGTLTSGFDANGNATGTVRDLMIHNYGAGAFDLGSAVIDNGGDAVNLVLGGTGVTRLTGTNLHTGGTFLVGGTVEVGADSALGATPGAPDADNLYFNGGTLRPTQNLVIDSNRGITLGGEGATFEVGAGLQLDYGGIIDSEDNYQSTANGYGRTVAFNPDFGGIVKTGNGVLNLTPAVNNTYEGLTHVQDGTLRITTPTIANTSGFYDFLGTDQSWTGSTIVENGATLEINFTGTTGAGDWVNQEWLILKGEGHDGGGAFRTTGLGRAFSTTGQVYVDGTTRFNLSTGYIYLANGGGYLASLDANPATPDNIIFQGAGNFHIYSNAPDWYGSLTLVGNAARIYNGAALPNLTSLTLERNNYFEIRSDSGTVDRYHDQLPDHMPVYMSGRPRMRLYTGGNAVYSGFQNTGPLNVLSGEPALQFDSAMDLSASSPGAALSSNTYDGMIFDQIVRSPGALLRFGLIDSLPEAWTDLSDVKSAVAAGWADFTFGVTTFKDVVTVAVVTAPATIGGQLTSEAPDRAIIPGFVGGTRLPYIHSDSVTQRDDENYYARRAITVDTALNPQTGLDPLTILRPLKTSEYTTLANPGTDVKNGVELSSAVLTGAQDNLRLVGLNTDTLGTQASYLTGRRDSIVYLQSDLTINHLAFEQDSYISDNPTSAGTGRGNMVSLDIGLGRTLTIDSGQIVFAATAVSDRGGTNTLDTNRNQYNWSFIHGGNIDFNGQEAILVNNSLWHHYNTADSANAFRSTDGDYSEAYIGSSIVNANGLTKGGAASIHLMMPNEINGPVNINYGSLYARHNQALGGASEVNVNGGNFIVASGASIQGVDIHYRLQDADRIALQLEQGSIFGADLVIHNVDSAGSANVNNYAARALLRSSNSVGIMAGNIYGSNAPISNLLAATQPRLVSTNGSGANGTLWFRGTFSDKAGGVPVDPNTNPNEVLRFEITGNDTFQLWIDQPWKSAGRIEHERGYVRYLGTGDFWDATAAALLDPSNPVSGYVMGGDTANGNYQIGLLLTQDGQRFNIPSWQVGEELSNTTGNTTLGGGNMSGTVSFGTGAGSITFYNRSSSYDRDLTLVAARGGEVEIDANLVDGGANVNSSITKIRPGTVLLNGSSAGPGTVEGVNVMGGALVLQNYGTYNDRRIGQGAYLTGGGGALAMFNTAAVSPTEDLTGAVTVNPGASAVAIINASIGTTTLNLGSFTRNSGGTMAFLEQDAGFGSAVLTSVGGVAQPADTRIGSWATYGTQAYNLVSGQVDPIVSDWAAYDGSTGIAAFTGYTNDAFGGGVHTNILTSQLLAGATNTASVRFAQAGATQIDVNGNTFTIDDGGVLVATGTGASSILDGLGGGSLVSGTGEVIVHNYGSGELTIAADIGGTQSFTHAGIGTTTLSGTNTYSGTSYLNQGTVVVDSLARLGTGALYLGGATLRHTGTGLETIIRNITLGDSGAVIQLDDPNLILANKVEIKSEANAIASYTLNPLSGSLDITGSGTFTMGDSTAAANVTDVAGVNNSYQGLTVIGDGVHPTMVRVEGQPADYAYVTPFGAPDTYLNSTQIRNNATLAFSPKQGDGSRDNEVRIREWLVFGENATDTTYLVKDTNRTLDLIGVITVNGTLEVAVTSNTLRLGLYENGYLIGDANSVIRTTGPNTLEVRESSPDYKGSWEIRNGRVSFYGIGTPAGTGTGPIILGDTTGAATGLNRLWVMSEYGSNDDTAYNSMIDDLHLYHDIVITGQSGQDRRIGSGYQPADGATITFHGDIDIQSNLTATQRAFYMEYEDTEGISEAHTGHLQRVYINYLGNITNSGPGAGGYIEAYLGAGSANDDHDIYATFVLGGNNSGWNGEMRISNNTGATYDRDENVIVRLANADALDSDNVVRMRNQSTLQVGGQTVTIGGLITETGLTGDPSGAGFDPQTSGTNLITAGVSAIIENASTTPGNLTITQNNTASEVNWNALFRDGPTEVKYDPIGSTPAALSLVKTGAGTAVMTVGNFYTGATTVEEGALVLDFTSSDNSMLSDTGALTIGAATLQIDRGTAATGNHLEVVGSTTLAGAASITRGAGSTAVLQMNVITVNPGASVNFSAENIATTDTLNTNGILGTWATVGGTDFAMNSGATAVGDPSVPGPGVADGFVRAYNGYLDVTRLESGSKIIADGSTSNVRIVEGTGSILGDIILGAATTTIHTLNQSDSGGTSAATIDPAGQTLAVNSILVGTNSGALTIGNGTDNGTLTTATAGGDLLLQNFSSSSALTIASVIADNSSASSLTQGGSGISVLTGANTYTGPTLVTSGTLAIGDGGSTGTLGAGDVTLDTTGILAFNRSDTGLSVTNQLLGSGTVVQSGTGTTTLNAASPVSTLTFVMADGTLASGVDNAIHTTDNLIFGATSGATTVGALDLGGSATSGSLLVQTNTATANTMTIGAGKTLTTNGNVTIGIDGFLATAPSVTSFTVSGDGAWFVNQPGGTFQVGGATTTDNGNQATLNLSGLSSFTADLGSSGVFRVGDNANNGSGSGNTPSTATLADTSVITAGLIGIGDAKGAAAGIATLKLGSTSNILNADRIVLGDDALGRRGSGVLEFDTSTGTLTVRGTDGTSRADMDVLNSSSGTGYALTGTVNLAGHSADLLLDDLNIGLRSNGAGVGTGTFTFDTGTLDVTSVTLGNKTGGGGTAVVSGALNIGGGTVAVGSGGISMGFNGGTEASTASGTLNFTGGAVSVAGDITRGGTAGPGASIATFNLEGASLNMLGNDIGDATNPVTTVFASGTLSNVGEINGGGALEKTTSGTLILEGTNTYSGPTHVNDGILLVDGDNSGATGAVTVATGATLGGTGTIGGAVIANGGTLTAAGTDNTTLGTLNINGDVSASIPSTWLVNLTHNASGDPAGGAYVDLIRLGSMASLNPSNYALSIMESGAFVDGQQYRFADFSAGMWTNTDLFTYNGNPLLQDGVIWGDQGGRFTIDYNETDNAFYLISAIPEPATLLPLALLLIAGLLPRRRRRVFGGAG